MKKWMIFSFMLFGLSGFGQFGFVKGFSSLEEDGIAWYRDVLIDNDTIVLYASARDSVSNQWGIKFIQLDSFGNVLSEVLHVDTVNALVSQEFRKKIITTDDGGYAIIGSAGLPTLYLLKVNHDLSLDFLQKYVAEDSATLLNASLIEVNDGFLLLGDQRIDSMNHEIFVMKTDAQGNDVWRKIYDAGPNMQSNPFEIHALDENTFVIGAIHTKSKNPGSGVIGTWNRSYMLCIDSLGNVKWDWESDDAPEHSWILDFELLADSSWICMSGTWEQDPADGAYETRPMILRMDKNFNVMWQKIFDVPWGGIQLLSDLERLPDSNYLVSGYFYDWDAQKYKGVHYKFAANGDSLWMRLDTVFSGDSDTHIKGTDILSSGSIISVGYADKTDGTYGFVMKLSPDGCIDTVNCWPVADSEPFAQAEEVSVYPNPFSDYLTVNIPDYPQNAYIYFYDVMGRFLRKQRVWHGVNELDVGAFPEGMIFYEVRDDGVLMGRGKLVGGS